MECPDDVMLSAHVDGELKSAQAREIEAHIAGCDDCRNRIQDMKAADATAAEMFGAMAPPERDFHLAARPAHNRLRRRIGLVAAAACVAIAAGAGAWMALHSPAGPSADVPAPDALTMASGGGSESLADEGVLPLQLAAVEGETRSFEAFGPVESEAEAQAQGAEDLSGSWLAGAAPLERRVRRAADELAPWQAERRLEKCLFLIDVSRSVI